MIGQIRIMSKKLLWKLFPFSQQQNPRGMCPIVFKCNRYVSKRYKLIYHRSKITINNMSYYKTVSFKIFQRNQSCSNNNILVLLENLNLEHIWYTKHYLRLQPYKRVMTFIRSLKVLPSAGSKFYFYDRQVSKYFLYSDGRCFIIIRFQQHGAI